MKKTAGLVALAALASMSWGFDDGKEVIERTLDHYRTLDGTSVTMSLDIEFAKNMDIGPMMAESMSQTAYGVAIRPNTFAFWPKVKKDDPMAGMGMIAPSVYSDGSRMISAVADKGMYEDSAAPESFSAMLNMSKDDGLMSAWQMIVGAEVVIELMSVEPDKHAGQAHGDEDDERTPGILELLADARYKGIEGEGEGATHVFFVEESGELFDDIAFDVFVAAAGKPWVVAIKPDMEGVDSPMPEGMSVILRFSDWKAVDSLPDVARITPGEDWDKVDNLMESLMGGSMTQQKEADPHDTSEALGDGDKAVDFTLDTLGGPSFTLADNLGKVVVLDFWATWCPPCVAGLPVVTKVMRDYADKGVVFVAVNLREDPEEVAEFMKEKKWNFTVAFDGDGAISNKYGVTGIPHSVIIDQKGIVRGVHVGFLGAEKTDKMLREELDELLGG